MQLRPFSVYPVERPVLVDMRWMLQVQLAGKPAAVGIYIPCGEIDAITNELTREHGEDRTTMIWLPPEIDGLLPSQWPKDQTLRAAVGSALYVNDPAFGEMLKQDPGLVSVETTFWGTTVTANLTPVLSTT